MEVIITSIIVSCLTSILTVLIVLPIVGARRGYRPKPRRVRDL